jgi:hypothetical protein
VLIVGGLLTAWASVALRRWSARSPRPHLEST